MREKDALILKQDTAFRELSVQMTPVFVDTTSTQTEVDDDGLWDVQVQRGTSACLGQISCIWNGLIG